jgi:hypothetical protein
VALTFDLHSSVRYMIHAVELVRDGPVRVVCSVGRPSASVVGRRGVDRQAGSDPCQASNESMRRPCPIAVEANSGSGGVVRDQCPREVVGDFIGSGLQGRQGDGLVGFGTQGE